MHLERKKNISYNRKGFLGHFLNRSSVEILLKVVFVVAVFYVLQWWIDDKPLQFLVKYSIFDEVLNHFITFPIFFILLYAYFIFLTKSIFYLWITRSFQKVIVFLGIVCFVIFSNIIFIYVLNFVNLMLGIICLVIIESKKWKKNKISHKKCILSDDTPTDSVKGSILTSKNLLHNTINSLEDTTSYFSILLEGQWGIGKTSIIETLARELKKDYLFITIDAWDSKESISIVNKVENELKKIFSEMYFLFSGKELK